MSSRNQQVLLALLSIFALLSVSVPGWATCQCSWQNAIGTSDGDIRVLAHPYGAFPDEDPNLVSSHPTFDGLFDLYVTPGVTSPRPEGYWDSTLVEEFIDGVADETDMSDDAFALVWEYFGYGDRDPALESILFGDDEDHINIILYDVNDLNIIDSTATHPDSVAFYADGLCHYGNYPCSGFSTVLDANTLLLNAGCCSPPANLTRFVVEAFAHELQHLVWSANVAEDGIILSWTGSEGGWSTGNEGLSTLAEHVVGTALGWWPWGGDGGDKPYDSSVMQNEPCDLPRKYMIEQTWLAYLFDSFFGSDPEAIEDDVLYQWIRSPSSDPTKAHELSMRTLADQLWSSPHAASLGGGTADECLQNAFRYFAAAKFANAPALGPTPLYGYASGVSTHDNFGFFQDAFSCSPGSTPGLDCPDGAVSEGLAVGGCWDVRVFPPLYVLGAGNENALTTVSGIYTAGDLSEDFVDVGLYGTDYLVFEAEDDGQVRELFFTFSGSFPGGFANGAVQAAAIYYDTTADPFVDPLPTRPGNILSIQPIAVSENPAASGTFEAFYLEPDFGGAVKSVVIAIVPVEESPLGGAELAAHLQDDLDMFTYSYSFGVDMDDVDLTLDGSQMAFQAGRVRPGATNDLEVVVRNDGVMAVSDVEVQLYDPSGLPLLSPPYVIAEVGPLGSEHLAFPLVMPMTFGAYEVTIEVDGIDAIPEADETNNSLVRSCFVNPLDDGVATIGLGVLTDNDPFLASFTNDDVLEIGVVDGNGKIRAFRSNGIPLWTYPPTDQGTVAVWDHDLDGISDVVVGKSALAMGSTTIYERLLLHVDGSSGGLSTAVVLNEGGEAFWPWNKGIATYLDTPNGSPLTAVIGYESGGHRNPTPAGLFVSDPQALLCDRNLTNEDLEPVDLGVADLDGDGGHEIFLVARRKTTGLPVVQIIDGNCQMQAEWEGSSSATLDIVARAGDVDPAAATSTRPLELIVAYAESGMGSSRLVALHYDASAGTLTETASVTMSGTPPAFCLCDTDGDTVAEVACISGSSLRIYGWSSGQLQLLRSTTLTGATSRPPLAQDLDGDGGADLVVKSSGGGTFVAVYSGATLLPIWEPFEVASSGSASQGALGDLDADGRTEYVITVGGSSLIVLELEGTAGRMDWPVARGNVNGDNLLAQPVGGTYPNGLVIYNTAVVHADVEVPTAASLELVSGATVRTLYPDQWNIGYDTNRVEFNLHGPVKARGSRGLPITVESTGGTPGDWYRFLLTDPSANADLSWLTVRDADIGFDLIAPTTMDNVTITGCQTLGIKVRNHLAATNSTVSAIPTGIRCQSGAVLEAQGLTVSGVTTTALEFTSPGTGCRVQNSSLVGPGSGTGIVMDSASQTIDLSGCVVRSFQDGVSLTGASPGITGGNLFANSRSGLFVGDGSASVDNTTLHGNPTGALIEGGSSPTLTDCQVRQNTTGVKVDQGASPTLMRCALEDNAGDGLRALGGATPRVRGCTITGNDRGVYATGDSWPNLGIAPGDNGANAIHSNGSWQVYEDNSEAGTIKAEYNWWGVPRPSPSFFFGSVDFRPYLDVWMSMKGPGISMPATTHLFPSYPNPFRDRTRIDFWTAQDGRVSIDVYDIRGRLVRSLIDREISVGRHTTQWNGTDGDGLRVADGVYFLRMRVNGSDHRRKVVLRR